MSEFVQDLVDRSIPVTLDSKQILCTRYTYNPASPEKNYSYLRGFMTIQKAKEAQVDALCEYSRWLRFGNATLKNISSLTPKGITMKNIIRWNFKNGSDISLIHKGTDSKHVESIQIGHGYYDKGFASQVLLDWKPQSNKFEIDASGVYTRYQNRREEGVDYTVTHMYGVGSTYNPYPFHVNTLSAFYHQVQKKNKLIFAYFMEQPSLHNFKQKAVVGFNQDLGEFRSVLGNFTYDLTEKKPLIKLAYKTKFVDSIRKRMSKDWSLRVQMSNDWKVGMNIVGNLFEEMKIYGSYEFDLSDRQNDRFVIKTEFSI